MQLTTSGKPLKVPLSNCKRAIVFYCNRLMSNRLLNNIHININFVEKLKYKAECWADLNNRFFEINIRQDMGARSTLMSLAHEIVHVKQWATGELTDYAHKRYCKWQGEYFNTITDEDYWDSPWEIEAYGREVGLYKLFKKEIKNDTRERSFES